jgi:hypothetical protein
VSSFLRLFCVRIFVKTAAKKDAAGVVVVVVVVAA